ncbi:MAG: heme-binding protein [Rhodospirillales bacterium]|nr:heme-binding protein [Rhodospirillales bacterium]
MLKKIIAAAGLLAFLAVPAQAADGPTASFKSLTVEMAQKLANATLTACRKADFQVAVAVVDRSGVLQVLLRDRLAGPHTPAVAKGKAWTALSFRTDTTELSEATQAGKEASGIRQVPGAIVVGGGVMVRAAGQLVGAVGVSGAPSGTADDACARKGIEAVQDDLDF